MSYIQMLGIGALLVIAVFVPLVALAALAIAVVKGLVPQLCSKRWPYLIGIAAAWLGTLPVCGWIINATALSQANWGHAGEALFMPFLLLSPILIGVSVLLVKRLLRA